MLVYFSAQKNSASGFREAYTNSILSLAISVFEYYTAKNVMSWSYSAIWLRQSYNRDPISLSFFDHVALFSDFNRLFELLGPGCAPYSSNTFYILEWSSKIICKTLITNFMNNFHLGDACCSFKAFE